MWDEEFSAECLSASSKLFYLLLKEKRAAIPKIENNIMQYLTNWHYLIKLDSIKMRSP